MKSDAEGEGTMHTNTRCKAEEQRRRLKATAAVLSIFLIGALSAGWILMGSFTDRHISMWTPPLEIREAKYIPSEEPEPIVPEILEPISEESNDTDTVIKEDESPDEWYFSEAYFPQEEYESDVSEQTDSSYYDADYFMSAGVIFDGDTKYTWYSQNVLPGGGLDIPGRHVEDGYVVDGDGRIAVASTDFPYGTEIELPFGSGVGVVVDTGYLESGQIDVYTDF